MYSSHLKKLADLSNDHEFVPGTILRWYGVKRKSRRKVDDYYDLLLFDANDLKRNTWALINCTDNSGQIGHLYAVFNCKSRLAIKASVLKEFFDQEEVFVLTSES